ncbi:protein FRA10AC1 [Gastrophryne carolinensis]
MSYQAGYNSRNDSPTAVTCYMETPARGYGGYESDFSEEEEEGREKDAKKKRPRKTVWTECLTITSVLSLSRLFSPSSKEDEALLKKPFQKESHGKVAHKRLAAEEWDREEARNWRFHLISMDAFARHQKFVNDYILYYGGKMEDFREARARKTDLDVIRENHRFLWQEEDEEEMTWEKRLAKKYYDKLFKEYCIADLSRYKENKFGFRWRVEKEVVSGKGQFSCGNKRCDEKEGLKSWEVNFAYMEQGEKRNALVKLRLCPECSYKLNFHHKRKEVQPKASISEAESHRGPPLRKKPTHSHSHKKRRKHKAITERLRLLLSFVDTASDQEGGDDEATNSEFWKGSQQEPDEKSREEEFDEYFQDMFL